MTAYDMLPNIREHSLLVREVALYLGTSLLAAGLTLRLDLIEAGALLHDLGKTACLGTSVNHAEWGAKALLATGYPEVAQVVREHVFLQSTGKDPRTIREAEVVNYADKRVLHTRVVTLAARFVDLRERYGQSAEARSRIAGLEQTAQRLEARLFAHLSLDPADLMQLNHTRREL
jgi:putative nucleotidyltransferase with HDIG domain